MYDVIFDILACLYRISTISVLQVSLIPGHPALEWEYQHQPVAMDNYDVHRL